MSGALWRLDAAGLASAYRSGDASPEEAVRAHLDRIAEVDPVLNAFVHVSGTAMSEAAESARRIREGSPRSLLEGVPVAVKDNLVVAGMPAAWGSAVFADEPRTADELPVARLRAAGAVVLGKTNTPEFAVEGYTANARFGVTRNPWDPALTPGGSSGGAVAAVAAGLATAALGTDGGGSIRRPAAHTGLYGLKPGIGRVPRAGGLPQLLLDFEVAGPLARTPRDLRLMLDVLAGPDRRDPRSRTCPAPACEAGRALRILYVPRFGEAPCDPRILASVGAAMRRLADMGHVVVEDGLPFSLQALDAFWGRIAEVGLARLVETEPRMAERAGARYLAMAEQGRGVSATEFLSGLQAVERLRAEAALAFERFDAIATPAIAAQPWPAGQSHPTTIDGHDVGPRGHAVYTGWVNACGHPAVAIPAEPAADGMPIGFQMVGDVGSEHMLIGIAEAFDADRGGWRWPPLAVA